MAPPKIRDGVLWEAGATTRAVPPGAQGGGYVTSSGESVHVFTSPSYTPDQEISQFWAEFFARLPHMVGALDTLTVYFAPPEELSTICSDRADACYSPRFETIVLSGEGIAPDGTDNAEVAAHEFGHHVAQSSNNAPFAAIETGPKRWATYQNVCRNVLEGRLLAGDESPEGYGLNPAEGFAEAYRVAAGGNPNDWFIVDRFFFPDQGALDAISADIGEPWDGNSEDVHESRFRRGGSRVRVRRIRIPLDGDVKVDVESYGNLDVDLFLMKAGSTRTILAKGVRAGHVDRLKYRACGRAKADLVLYRYKGFGGFDYRVSTP
jgi:hypothetical protein